jgi:hypothetical protein
VEASWAKAVCTFVVFTVCYLTFNHLTKGIFYYNSCRLYPVVKEFLRSIVKKS